MKKFLKNLKPKVIVEWVGIAAAIFLCNSASFAGIRPFGIGLFVGLAYVRRNIFIMFPILLLSAVIVDPVWQSVITPCVLTVALTAAYFIHKLIKKKLKIYHLLIYTAISLVPSFFIYGLGEDLLYKLLEGGISVAFCWASINVCYLVYVKGLKYRLSSSDEICSGVVLSVFALALYGFSIKGIIPALAFYAFFSVLSISLFSERGLTLNVLLGLGCSLASGASAVAFTSLVAVICLFVRNRYVAAFVPAAVHIVLGAAFSLFPSYSIFNTLVILVGGVATMLIPQKVLDKILAFLGFDKGLAVRAIVNRNRLDVHNRLKKMSVILTDMQTVLTGGEKLPEARENKNYLAKELSKTLCNGCSKRSVCERALGASTSVGLYALVSAAAERGKVTILDLPSFLIENCDRSQIALTSCQTLMENYSFRKEISDNVSACKTMMREQLDGLSGMIDSFARELKESVTFDAEREKTLIEELSKVNIVASEAAVFDMDGLVNGFVVVREEDENKKILIKTMSKVLGEVVRDGKSVKSGGNVCISFVSAPRFDVYYGVASLSKDDEKPSGDVHSALRLSCDKVMFAVCDGMGSGERAAKNSESVISLVESFYKAGIDEGSVLSIINKLLSARGSEEFSALDMCVINLRSGTADFIKLGGVQSVIRRKRSIEKVEGGALPIGILENVRPYVARKTLNGGDMVVMYTDGVSDVLGADGVVRLTEQNVTANPETLADIIIKDVEYVGKKDDSTVLCVRIYERR